MMFKLKSASRLSITVGFICASLVWLALALNLAPDPHRMKLEQRLSVTRAIAVAVSSYAENNRYHEMGRLLERNLYNEPTIVSIGVRRGVGNRKLLAVGPHEKVWEIKESGKGQEHQIAVDIMTNGRKWGQMEIVFRSEQQGWLSGLAWFFGFPNGLVGFMAAAMTLMTWMVLAKTFRYLNPSKVVPDRVRLALDSIASGLVLVTKTGEIAHANRAFGVIVQRDVESVVGERIGDFGWFTANEGQRELPWMRCQEIQESVSGEIIEAKIASGVTQKYMVNASPIFGSKNDQRGVLVSFEDVTALESKKVELAKIIQTVRLSRDEVQRQNEQLNFLASYDPLTSCMNRRSFFGQYEKQWAEANGNPLSVIMFDIDHFKLVNDDHGHSAGDEVLKKVGEIMNAVVGKNGIVCRYGGEEFVILLPNLGMSSSTAVAEEIRGTIEATEIAGLHITASLGISGLKFGAMDPQHMLDQADECLYVAKRRGRNQVIRFDQCLEYMAAEKIEAAKLADAESDIAESDIADTKGPTAGGRRGTGVFEVDPQDQTLEIEHSSVTGLLSALSFRSPTTAEHSVRVADLAVAIGQKLLNQRELYRLEVAALLHDVGKIGVPDAILNKPEKLTESEWQIMRRHDEMGVAIVKSAFASQEIAAIIERHQNRASGGSDSSGCQPTDSISSKILHVCDAFDAMVSDQVYRQGMGVDQAIQEILKNTPNQFDGDVVTQLEDYLLSGHYQHQRMLSRERSLTEEESEFDRLISLADEVMELSQATRSTFIDTNLIDGFAAIPKGV